MTLVKGILGCRLFQAQTGTGECVRWMNCHVRWVKATSSSHKAGLCTAESTTKKRYCHTAKDISLLQMLLTSTNSHRVKKFQIKGRSRDMSEAYWNYWSSADLRGYRVRKSRMRELLFCRGNHPLCFISPYSSTDDGSQTNSVHAARESIRAEHRQQLYANWLESRTKWTKVIYIGVIFRESKKISDDKMKD